MNWSMMRASALALALTVGWCLAYASAQQPLPAPKPSQPPTANPNQNQNSQNQNNQNQNNQQNNATPQSGTNAGNQQGQQQGVHVEERGEVHEAFARPWQHTVNPTSIIHKQPPDPISEEPPSERPSGKNVQWIPGYWQWSADRNDFNWISGTWRDTPEGRHWVVGHWVPVADGWYRVAGHWAAQQEPDFQYVTKPPEPREEQQPTAPDQNAIWIPGSWFFTENGWQWRAGYYAAPRDGYVWQPSSYDWSPNGYVYTSGYWDYDPYNRGLLFAPVWFDRPYWEDRGWFYRPFFALDVARLWASLFVRPGWGYYFGDWRDRRFGDLGFRPWFEFGERRFDPLFSYERWSHRNDPSFFNNIRTNFQAGVTGRANVQGGANVAGGGKLVVPLNQLHDVNSNIRLETVTPQMRTSIMENARTMHEHALNLGRGNFPANMSTNLRGNVSGSTSYHYGAFQPGTEGFRPESQQQGGFQNISPIHPSFGGYHSWGGGGGGGGGGGSGHGGGHR